MRIAATLSALTIVAASATAQAATTGKSYASLALTKTEDVSRADDAKGEDKVTILNFSAGFGMGSGLMLGAKYFDYSNDDKVTENEHMVISGWGPMVGYMHDSGIYANLAYLLAPTKTYKYDDDKTTFEGGSGYVIDFGKVWAVGTSFGVGVAMTQSKVTYKEAKSSGTEVDLDGEWSDSSLYPYISLFLFF